MSNNYIDSNNIDDSSANSNTLINLNLFRYIYSNQLYSKPTLTIIPNTTANTNNSINSTVSNMSTNNGHEYINTNKYIVASNQPIPARIYRVSSNKRSWWWSILAFTLLSAGAAAAYYWFWYKKKKDNNNNDNNNDSKLSKLDKSGNSNQSSNASASIDIAERDLVGLLLQSMDNLQSHGIISGELEQSLYSWLFNLDIHTSSAGLKLLSVQWLLLYITMEGMHCISKSEYDLFQSRIINKDLKLGIKLLNDLSNTNMAAELLRLELNQRIRDYNNLSIILDRIILYRGLDLTYEETIVLFTSFPLLGRWNEFISLGNRIIQVQSNLLAFHSSAQTRRDIPDYSVLFDIINNNYNYINTNWPKRLPNQLDYTELQIKSFALRFNTVETDNSNNNTVNGSSNSNDSSLQSIINTFDPQGTRSWKYYNISSNDILIINGSIAQLDSKSSFPITMVGPCLYNYNNPNVKDKLLVRGFIDIDCTNNNTNNNSTNSNISSHVSLTPTTPSASSPIILRQTEEYYLERENNTSNNWNGEYILIQERLNTTNNSNNNQKSSKSKAHKVKVKFDLRVTMEVITPLNQ